MLLFRLSLGAVVHEHGWEKVERQEAPSSVTRGEQGVVFVCLVLCLIVCVRFFVVLFCFVLYLFCLVLFFFVSFRFLFVWFGLVFFFSLVQFSLV